MSRTVTKSLGKAKRRSNRACHACHREFGVYLFPMDAVELAADIHALEQAIELLHSVDELHIIEVLTPEDSEAAYNIKRITISRISRWLRQANRLLATQYLAPDERALKRRPRKMYDATWKPIVDRIKELGEEKRARERVNTDPQQTDSD